MSKLDRLSRWLSRKTKNVWNSKKHTRGNKSFSEWAKRDSWKNQ